MPIIDGLSYWSDYLSYISNQEASISNVVNYLSNHLNLLESATLHLKGEFPVYDNVMLVYLDEYLPGQSSEEKIKFSQKIFEILFSYSKNLLINFSIYQDRAIKADTPQIRDYLSKFPSYSSYFILMGYVFHEDTNEFKFPEDTLIREQQLDLICMTICCCLTYDYWINRFKYLSLTIFADHRLSIENLLKGRRCEFCEYEIDPSLFQCTVCFSQVDKMPFYDKWQRNIINQSTNGLHKKLKNKFHFHSLNDEESKKKKRPNFPDINHSKQPTSLPMNLGAAGDTWQCVCSYVNSTSQLNCVVCFNERPPKEIPKIAEKAKTDTNPDMTEINVNNTNIPIFSPVPEKLEINNGLLNNEWICNFCGTKNSMSTYNCANCYKKDPNFVATPELWNDSMGYTSGPNENEMSGDNHGYLRENSDGTQDSSLLNDASDYSLLRDHDLAPKENIDYGSLRRQGKQDATVISIDSEEDKQSNGIRNYLSWCWRAVLEFLGLR